MIADRRGFVGDKVDGNGCRRTVGRRGIVDGLDRQIKGGIGRDIQLGLVEYRYLTGRDIDAEGVVGVTTGDVVLNDLFARIGVAGQDGADDGAIGAGRPPR